MSRVEVEPVQHVELGSVANALFESESLKFGNHILRSGRKSPYYIDLGQIQSFPLDHKKVVVAAYGDLIKQLTNKPNRLAPVPTRINPIVSSLSDLTGIPMFTPRWEEKNHGSQKLIDGVYKSDELVAVIDDVITGGGSKLRAIEICEQAGLKVQDVVVLVDREEGGREQLENAGYRLHAFCTMSELAEHSFKEGLVSEEHFNTIINYIRNLSPTPSLIV